MFHMENRHGSFWVVTGHRYLFHVATKGNEQGQEYARLGANPSLRMSSGNLNCRCDDQIGTPRHLTLPCCTTMVLKHAPCICMVGQLNAEKLSKTVLGKLSMTCRKSRTALLVHHTISTWTPFPGVPAIPSCAETIPPPVLTERNLLFLSTTCRGMGATSASRSVFFVFRHPATQTIPPRTALACGSGCPPTLASMLWSPTLVGGGQSVPVPTPAGVARTVVSLGE